MDEIQAQELNGLSEQLTATRDEIYQMGHQFEELIVHVRRLTLSHTRLTLTKVFLRSLLRANLA